MSNFFLIIMNDLYNRNNDLFNYIHPCLKNNFSKLCTDGKIGLIPVSVNKINFQKAKLLDNQYAYNFKIQIPYAGKSLAWEILFNPEDMKFAPDFDFNEDGFPQSLNVDEIAEEIPTLLNWDLENSGSLEAVLKEFLQMYKKYQIKELNSNNIYSRISDEYQLLMSVPDLSADDVELLIDNNSVQFLISVRIDLSNLPEYIQDLGEDGSLLNPKEDFALLLLIFHKLDASKVTVQLQLSPRLDQLIGKSRRFHTPGYEKDASLVEYVPLISNILQEEVDEVAFQYHFKKQFITSLITLRSRSIVEYDSTNFDKITFLCELDNFYTLIQVIICNGFPRDKPIVKLNSPYCVDVKTKVPCEKLLEFRHISNRAPDEMARYILEQVKKYIPEFKLHAHSNSTRNQ